MCVCMYGCVYLCQCGVYVCRVYVEYMHVDDMHPTWGTPPGPVTIHNTLASGPGGASQTPNPAPGSVRDESFPRGFARHRATAPVIVFMTHVYMRLEITAEYFLMQYEKLMFFERPPEKKTHKTAPRVMCGEKIVKVSSHLPNIHAPRVNMSGRGPVLAQGAAHTC